MSKIQQWRICPEKNKLNNKKFSLLLQIKIVYCVARAGSELFLNCLPARATHTIFCHASGFIDRATTAKVIQA